MIHYTTNKPHQKGSFEQRAKLFSSPIPWTKHCQLCWH